MSAMNAKEAASLLGLSARKLYELAQTGQIACYRFGGAVRFDRADLEAYKTSCRSPATTRAAAPVLAAESEVFQQFGVYEDVHPKPTKQELSKQKKAQDKRRKQIRAVLVRHHAAKRRAVKLQRTPAWADMKSIKGMHDQAARLTLETGIIHHVDHIFPMQGKLVSGLHVHQNMQVLTGPANSSKGNRFEVEL